MRSSRSWGLPGRPRWCRTRPARVPGYWSGRRPPGAGPRAPVRTSAHTPRGRRGAAVRWRGRDGGERSQGWTYLRRTDADCRYIDQVGRDLNSGSAWVLRYQGWTWRRSSRRTRRRGQARGFLGGPVGVVEAWATLQAMAAIARLRSRAPRMPDSSVCAPTTPPSPTGRGRNRRGVPKAGSPRAAPTPRLGLRRSRPEPRSEQTAPLTVLRRCRSLQARAGKRRCDRSRGRERRYQGEVQETVAQRKLAEPSPARPGPVRVRGVPLLEESHNGGCCSAATPVI